MNKIITILTVLVLMTGIASAQPTNSKSPFNPFSTVENFVEGAEVQLAGAIGGPDLKAKALANNAEEALQEAEKLAERNRSEATARKIEKYEKNLNKSKNILDKGENKELDNKVQNLSNQNIQRLVEVKKKVPKEAQKGIEKAINNSKKRNERENKPEEVPEGPYPVPPRPGNDKTPNFLNKTIKTVNSSNTENISNRSEKRKSSQYNNQPVNRSDKEVQNDSTKKNGLNRTQDNQEPSGINDSKSVNDSSEKPLNDNNSQPSLGR